MTWTCFSRRWSAAALVPILILLWGCDLFGDDESEPVVLTESVVVANGGNFGDQNGYLSLYDPETGTVTSSTDLGGFAHGIAVHNNQIFVLLNTFSTGRISIVDGSSGTVSGQIQDIPGPRGIAFVDGDHAYVTNLSAFGQNGPEPGEVSFVDLQAGMVDGDGIEVGVYPEGVVAHDGRIFVANSGSLGDGTTLSVINGSTNQVSGTIELGCDGPNEIFVDAQDELVIVCEGKVVYNEDFTEVIDQTPGQIVVVDPSAQTVKARLILETQAGSENGSQSAYYDASSEELYIIHSASGSIYRYLTDTNTLNATFLVPKADDLIGMAAIAYDGLNGLIYVAQLARGAGGFPDFSASGAVLILDRSGRLVNRFTVGPSPSHIEFLRRTE